MCGTSKMGIPEVRKRSANIRAKQSTACKRRACLQRIRSATHAPTEVSNDIRQNIRMNELGCNNT